MIEENIMDEDWALVRSMLPEDWEEKARETGALKGLRKHKDAGDYLRILLMHLACGYSLRETVARALEGKLADFSDVALLKRLRKAKDWLHALCMGLLAEQIALRAPEGTTTLRLIDATLIQEEGPTGSHWRVHYSLQWPQLRCDHFELTGAKGRGTGESLTHFPVQAGDHLVADRVYSNYASIRHVASHGGVVTVRVNPKALRLLTLGGRPFRLRQKLSTLQRANQINSWAVDVTGSQGQEPVRGRLCVVRKSQAAIAKAEAKVKRDASSNGRKLQEDTLLYCQYVIVFTTAAATLSARQILEIYRLRWQIELVFKRLKQLAKLGHLPKEDEESSKAWLYGKLLAALLTERLLQLAESVSPWGYDLAQAPQSQPLARV